MEFRGEQTEMVLEEFGIKHLYTSPYTPSSNGAVERLNRTLLGLVKALVSDDMSEWDQVLTRAIILYNNTYHSQLNMSPSDYLMKNSHTNQEVLPIDKTECVTWKEGNPNFKSFDINQKVLKEIKRVGDRASYKLMPKFDGPFIVRKIQSNGLTYEIAKPGEPDTVFKCHHKKLRAYNELPENLRKFIPVDVEDEEVTYRRGKNYKNPNKEEDTSFWSDSSSQPAFEGFPVISTTESGDSLITEDEGDKVRKQTVKKKTIKSRNKQKIKRREKDPNERVHMSLNQDEEVNENEAEPLQTFHCSERVNEDKYKNSTPKNGNDINMNEHMKNNLIEFSLSTLEKTISEHEDILLVVDEEQNSLNSLLSDLSIHMNNAFIETRHTEDNASYDYSGFQESPSFHSLIEDRIGEMKKIVAEGRKSIADGRERSKCLRREFLEWRKSLSFNTTAGNTTFGQMDGENGELLADRMSSTPKRRQSTEIDAQTHQIIAHPYWLRSRKNH